MRYSRQLSKFLEEFNFWFEQLLYICYIDGSYTNPIICLLAHELNTIKSGTDLILRNNDARGDLGFPDPHWILYVDRKKIKIDRAIGAVGEGFRMKGDGLGVVGKGGMEPNEPNHQNEQSNFLDDEELLKKHIAINCLRAASEQNIGIEELINEICIQMKNSKVDSESPFVEPKINYLSPLTASYENVNAELNLYDETLPSLNGGLKLEDEEVANGIERIEPHRKCDQFDPNLASDEESGGSDKENFNDGFLQTLIGASNLPLYNTATVGFSTALRFYGSSEKNFNGANGVFRLPSKEPDPNIWKNSPPLLLRSNKGNFSFLGNDNSSQLFDPEDVVTGCVYTLQEQDQKVKYEDQAFGNDEVSSRSSGGDNDPKVELENSPSLDSQTTGLEPDFQDSEDWQLEYCRKFHPIEELDLSTPVSTIWDYPKKSLHLSSLEKSIGDTTATDEFSELPLNTEEFLFEKGSSDSQSPSTKSDKTSDDEIEELFHLLPEEFEKQTANDSALTDGLDRWNPKSKGLTQLGGECRGLGNTIFHLWEGSNGRLLSSQNGRESFWPVCSDTSQDVKNWISEQSSQSFAKWVPKQSLEKLEHLSPIHVSFNHDENSSFVTYIPVPEEQGFSSTEGCLLSPKVKVEDPLQCEDLLHSEATHFAPINPDLGDGESNCDTEASLSALEKSATNIKAKKKDDNRIEKKSESQKLTVKESLLSAPLSLLDIERCASLDAQLEEERKIIRAGYKSKMAVDCGSNTEAMLASPISQKRLDPILELDNGEPPLSTKLEDLIAFQRDKRIWGHGLFNNVDSASISSYGMGINFRQASWSTSDGADETDSNSTSGYEESFNVEELVNTPEPNVAKDGNNNETVVAEGKVDEETEEATSNAASFDDEEVFELLRIQEEIPTEPYSKENADVSPEEFEVDNELPAIPTNNALYSSELEDEWHRLSQPFDIQVPRKSAIVKLGDDWHSPHRRPCSFYLEGNCRRSDCKFSHDLSTITCRFWEEGSCFKGVTCPFLHGYSSYQDDLSPLPFSPLISEEIQTGIVSSPAPPKWNFKLESEKDFPSLSASSLKETDSNSLPLSSSSDDSKSIKKISQTRKEGGFGRIIRPKKSKKSFSNQLPISLSRNEIKQQHQENLIKKRSPITRNDNTLKT